MIERWRRKLIEKGEIKAPAIVVMGKKGPRGLTKDEIERGLAESRERGEPALLDWEYEE